MLPELLNLIAVIVIFGILMWLINAFIPMPPAIKSLLNVLVVIVLIIYILQFFGLVNAGFPRITLFR